MIPALRSHQTFLLGIAALATNNLKSITSLNLPIHHKLHHEATIMHAKSNHGDSVAFVHWEMKTHSNCCQQFILISKVPTVFNLTHLCKSKTHFIKKKKHHQNTTVIKQSEQESGQSGAKFVDVLHVNLFVRGPAGSQKRCK